MPVERLRRRIDPASLGFGSTETVAPLYETLGQERAMGALRFGVGVDSPGFNLFITGISGSGRTSTVRAFLERIGASRPAPDDLVYVNNFDDVDRPSALSLPAGSGRAFATDIDSFIDQARQQIRRAFETERYADRRRQLAAELAARRDPEFEDLRKFALERGFVLEAGQGGVMAAPAIDGRPMTPDEMQALPEDTRKDYERRGIELQSRIGTALRRLAELEREGSEMLMKLDREIASFAIEPLLHGLREKYGAQPGALAHLARIADDVPNHLSDFRQQAQDHENDSAALSPIDIRQVTDRTNRYRVNVVVENDPAAGAPVNVEANPTYYNLVGRVEYRATFGTMVTDFRQIKAGALHRANGGFLILDAADVISNPFAWPSLIRALSTGQIRIENLGEQYSAVPTASLSPAPVPLRLKVVLIGTPRLYQLLYDMEEEFRELFKVRVDFSPEVDWTPETVVAYAAFITRRIGDKQLKHFDAGAVARVIEEAARWRESQRKLSTRLRDLDDLLTEASYWAGQQSHGLVTSEDVRRAVAEKERRSSLAEERLREMIADGTLRVEVEGVRTGQLNGLSVIELGDHRFGVPSRISATTALGRGTVDSIERETEMGGPIHNKGFLIVSGYLASTYAQHFPLALRATLTFEQSYDGVEGDSASSTELYALLSALSGVPLKQSIAVTGSVDQHGYVQAVGGVTDKVEGFFKICSARGLTGDQGVMIPVANLPHLMLDDEVIDAVRAGRFHLWAVDTIDQGIEVLTGTPAGERQPDGTFSEGSIHALVSQRLRGYARVLTEFATPGNGEATAAKAAVAKPGSIPAA